MATTTVFMDPDGGRVSVTLTFEGRVEWVYKYGIEDGVLRRTSTQGAGAERCHDLGTPAELHFDSHDWDIRIARLGADEDEVTITLVWTQEGVAGDLHRQTYTATLTEGNEAAVFNEDGIFLIQRPRVEA